MKTQTKKVSLKSILSILCFVLSVSGGLSLCIFAFIFAATYPTTNWPNTQGQVVKSEISVFNIGPGFKRQRYRAVIHYNYIISGNSYTGKRRARLDVAYSKKKDAQAVCDSYKIDSPVIVYYNPQRPGESILKRGVPEIAKNLFCVAFFSLAISGCLFFTIKRKLN